MNFEKINGPLSLAANVGVILGIVFLAVEIQQNTSMTRAQTRDSITSKQLDWYALVAGDTETLEAFNRALTSLDELDPNGIDVTRANIIVVGNFRIWENEWYQYQQGLFEEAEFVPRLAVWQRQLRNSVFLNVWNDQKANYSPDFRDQVDQLIEENQMTGSVN